MRILIAISALMLAFPAAAQSAPTAGQAVPAATPTASLLGAVLNARNVEREIAFYRDGIGMVLAMTLNGTHGTEYMMSFGGDPRQPGIILQNDPTNKKPSKQGTAFNRLVLRVVDMDAMVTRLDKAGYPHTPIRDVAMGYRMMMLTDPESNRLELVQIASKK